MDVVRVRIRTVVGLAIKIVIRPYVDTIRRIESGCIASKMTSTPRTTGTFNPRNLQLGLNLSF